jgi:septal ring factor EnvC (AmiA/AmiB activator)
VILLRGRRPVPRRIAGASGMARAFGLCLLAVGAAFASSEEASEREIQALRAKIAASRARVVGTEQAERDLLLRIEDLDQDLDALRVQVERSRRSARAAGQAHARVKAEGEASARRLAALRRAKGRRAVALYKAGEVGPLQVLFASADLPEMLVRMGQLRRLLTYDSELVAGSQEEYARAQALALESEAARQKSEAAHSRMTRRNAALSAERVARAETLDAVQLDRVRERALLVELEEAARTLQQTLARFKARRAEYPGASFAQRKGALVRPVRGRVRRAFGKLVDPRYQTEIFHKGLEIQADRGDRVRAVAPGRVRLAGWFRGYGKLVIVDHGDGYFTVSGHLDDVYVEVGDSVDEGDTLGTVGETGSLQGPGLYFEVRRGSGPLNPAEWLAKG